VGGYKKAGEASGVSETSPPRYWHCHCLYMDGRHFTTPIHVTPGTSRSTPIPILRHAGTATIRQSLSSSSMVHQHNTATVRYRRHHANIGFVTFHQYRQSECLPSPVVIAVTIATIGRILVKKHYYLPARARYASRRIVITLPHIIVVSIAHTIILRTNTILPLRRHNTCHGPSSRSPLHFIRQLVTSMPFSSIRHSFHCHAFVTLNNSTGHVAVRRQVTLV